MSKIPTGPDGPYDPLSKREEDAVWESKRGSCNEKDGWSCMLHLDSFCFCIFLSLKVLLSETSAGFGGVIGHLGSRVNQACRAPWLVCSESTTGTLLIIMEVCWSSFHGETFRFPLFFMVRPSDFHSFLASSRQTVVFTAEHPMVKPPAHTLRWHFLQDNIRRLWDHLDSLGSSQKAVLIRI